MRVKGKLLPVKIYELISEKALPPNDDESLKHFKEGYSLYYKKSFKDAIEAFEKANSLKPQGDPCSELYIQRCQDFIDTPPPEDWDGVFVMKTK